MIREASILWNCLSLPLWAYKTTKSITTKQTPFSLVYGAKSLLPVEINLPSARMLLSFDQENSSRSLGLEILEGKIEQV